MLHDERTFDMPRDTMTPDVGSGGVKSGDASYDAYQRLVRMRRLANGMLLAIMGLFVFSHMWEPYGQEWDMHWRFVRAFAEAAMVGGLADWFAVTAIFRHPLGLPIPHTAVIPKNQDRIAEAVGRFIADNFLKPELVAERVKDKDLSEALGKWLAEPTQSTALAGGLVSAVPALLDALDDETVAAFLREQAAEAAEGASVAPAFGSVLEALAEQGRHQAILDALLKQGYRLLESNQDLIRDRIRGRSGWLMRFVSDRQTEASFDFFDANQRLIARLEGWQDRYFSIPHAYYQCRLHPQSAFLSYPWAIAEPVLIRRIDPFPEGFFEDSWGIWQRVLAHLSLSEPERQRWYAFPAKGKRRTEWLLGRIAAKDAVRQWALDNLGLTIAPVDITIVATGTGKPVIECARLAQITALPDLSISHSQGYTVAALATPGNLIGVDLQQLSQNHADDLLVAAFGPGEQSWLQIGGAQQVAASLWCAKEAAAKAVGLGLGGDPRKWKITNCSPDVQRVEVTFETQILQVSLNHQAEEILAVCQRPVPR
jgi:phosphopantetheinyl transferase